MEITKTKRFSGIELLRVISMFLIIASHYANHGVGLISTSDWMNKNLFHRVVLSCFSLGGEYGVGVFFIITGFFMLDKEISVLHFKSLIKTVYYYALLCFILSIFFYFFFPEIISLSMLKSFGVFTLIPISYGSWWFISVYVFVYITIPFLNSVIREKKTFQHVIIVILLFVLWMVISIKIDSKYALIEKGLFYYFLGTLLYRIKDYRINNLLLIIIFITCLFSYNTLGYYYNSGIDRFLIETGVGISKVLLCGLSVYIAYQNKFYHLGINTVSKMCLSVYLIHTYPSLNVIIWFNAKKIYFLNSSNFVFIILVLGYISLVFLLCLCIDFVRIMVTKKYFRGR